LTIANATQHQGTCVIQEHVEGASKRVVVRINTTWNFLCNLRDDRFCTCAKLRIRLQRRKSAVEIQSGQGYRRTDRILFILGCFEVNAFEPCVLRASMSRGLNFIGYALLISFDCTVEPTGIPEADAQSQQAVPRFRGNWANVLF